MPGGLNESGRCPALHSIPGFSGLPASEGRLALRAIERVAVELSTPSLPSEPARVEVAASRAQISKLSTALKFF